MSGGKGKQLLLIFFLVLLLLLAAGCGMSEEKIVSRAEKNLKNTNSYYAVLETVIHLGGEPRDEYHVAMWYKAPDNYRIDITNKSSNTRQLFLSQGENRYIYEPQLKDLVPLVANKIEDLPPFALQSFWKSVIDARELTLLGEEKGDRESYYIVELIPRETDCYHSQEKTWLEKKSLLPVRVEVYGEGGNLSRVMYFQRVTLNLDLEDNIFDPEKVKQELLPEE